MIGEVGDLWEKEWWAFDGNARFIGIVHSPSMDEWRSGRGDFLYKYIIHNIRAPYVE